jgi:fructose-1,6-bisphosphatase
MHEGTEGPRGLAYTMRWTDSLVAALHRILIRGGVFLMPRDTRAHGKGGHLHLLYEANPVAMLVEQAGGAATTGRLRVLDVMPEDIHQRIPLIFGSKPRWRSSSAITHAFDRGESLVFDAPLFKKRSLFRTA